jgi:hypothetical protein
MFSKYRHINVTAMNNYHIIAVGFNQRRYRKGKAGFSQNIKTIPAMLKAISLKKRLYHKS